MGRDKEALKNIYVNHINNLNKDQKLLTKVEKHDMTTFGALCCESGPVSLNYFVEKSGFVCGEKIRISTRVRKSCLIYIPLRLIIPTLLQLTNNSDKKLEIKAKLMQVLIAHGSYKGKTARTKKKFGKKKPKAATNIVKKSKTSTLQTGKALNIGIVEGNDEKTYESEMLIPELPPTHRDTKAMEIAYKLVIEVK